MQDQRMPAIPLSVFCGKCSITIGILALRDFFRVLAWLKMSVRLAERIKANYEEGLIYFLGGCLKMIALEHDMSISGM